MGRKQRVGKGTQNNDVLNSWLWNSRNEILDRATALIPELYLQSGWNGMRRKEAGVGDWRKEKRGIDFSGFLSSRTETKESFSVTFRFQSQLLLLRSPS